MPGFDRSGPMGAGPMTGGQRGLCNRSGNVSDFPTYSGLGYGRGMGFGPGRAWRRGYGRRCFGYPAGYDGNTILNGDDEMRMLKAEADAMKKSLEALQKRIQDLDRGESSE